MTDIALTTDATTDAEAKHHYDEDLLVELLAAGELSQREIARRTGASAMMVSEVSRGRKRTDLHERICLLVEDAHRHTRRRAAASIDAVYQKYLALALESEGETARRACEFILKTFANTPDPAGRYIGLKAQGAGATGSSRALSSPVTREEIDLLALLRDDPHAPAFKALARPMRDRLKTLVSDGTYVEPVFSEDDFYAEDDGSFAAGDYIVTNDAPGLRRQLSVLRRKAQRAFGPTYLGENDDLEPDFTPDQLAELDAAHFDPTALATAHDAVVTESSIIRTLARLHLGRGFLEDLDRGADTIDEEDILAMEQQPLAEEAATEDPSAESTSAEKGTSTENGASGLTLNPQSEIRNPQWNALEAASRHVLLFLRDIERRHFFQGRPDTDDECDECDDECDECDDETPDTVPPTRPSKDEHTVPSFAERDGAAACRRGAVPHEGAIHPPAFAIERTAR